MAVSRRRELVSEIGSCTFRRLTFAGPLNLSGCTSAVLQMRVDVLAIPILHVKCPFSLTDAVDAESKEQLRTRSGPRSQGSTVKVATSKLP